MKKIYRVHTIFHLKNAISNKTILLVPFFIDFYDEQRAIDYFKEQLSEVGEAEYQFIYIEHLIIDKTITAK